MDPTDPVLIGTSIAIQRVREDVACASRNDVKVLITGERGLGKETLCRHIHACSSRAGRPLVAVDCGDLTGARFVPAVSAQFTLAADGTVFFDNLHALEADAQTGLLRFLDSGRLDPGAGAPTARHNVRVIAASSRNLHELIARGEFSAELYYRLNVLHITVAPLRERREDVPGLVRHFLGVLNCRNAALPPSLYDDIMNALDHHDWPGNIREVRELIQQVVVNWKSRRGDPLEPLRSPNRRMRARP